MTTKTLKSLSTQRR